MWIGIPEWINFTIRSALNSLSNQFFLNSEEKGIKVALPRFWLVKFNVLRKFGVVDLLVYSVSLMLLIDHNIYIADDTSENDTSSFNKLHFEFFSKCIQHILLNPRHVFTVKNVFWFGLVKH